MAKPRRLKAKLAQPSWIQFLRTVIVERGDLKRFGIARAKLDASNERIDQALAKRYADVYAQWLRDDPPFPEPSTVVEFSQVLQSCGSTWACEALTLFAAGHLREFVLIVGNKGEKITKKRLMTLLDHLAGATRGDTEKRATWCLTPAERTALPTLSSIRKNRLPESAHLRVALALADDWEINDYDVQRGAVVAALKHWVIEVPRLHLRKTSAA